MLHEFPSVDSCQPDSDELVGAYDLWPNFPSPDLLPDSPCLTLHHAVQLLESADRHARLSSPLYLMFTIDDYDACLAIVRKMARENAIAQHAEDERYFYQTLMQCFRILSASLPDIRGKRGAQFAEIYAFNEAKRLASKMSRRRQNDALASLPMAYITPSGLYLDPDMQAITWADQQPPPEQCDRYRRIFFPSYAQQVYATRADFVHEAGVDTPAASIMPPALHTPSIPDTVLTPEDMQRWRAVAPLVTATSSAAQDNSAIDPEGDYDFNSMSPETLVEFVYEAGFDTPASEFHLYCQREFFHAIATWECATYQSLSAANLPVNFHGGIALPQNIARLNHLATRMDTLMTSVLHGYYNVNRVHRMASDCNILQLPPRSSRRGALARSTQAIATNKAGALAAMRLPGPLHARVRIGAAAKVEARVARELQEFYAEIWVNLSKLVHIWSIYEPLYIETSLQFLTEHPAPAQAPAHIALLQTINAGNPNVQTLPEVPGMPTCFTYYFENIIRSNHAPPMSRLSPSGLAARLIQNVTAAMTRNSSFAPVNLLSPAYRLTRAARSTAYANALVFKYATWTMQKATLALSQPPTRPTDVLVPDPATFRINLHAPPGAARAFALYKELTASSHPIPLLTNPDRDDDDDLLPAANADQAPSP